MKKAKLISFVMVWVFVLSLFNSSVIMADTNEESKVLSAFQNPNAAEKPMARMWFPDAGAGLDDYDTIETQVNALAEAGFGGVEVSLLADGIALTNDECADFGWGTEAWRNLLKKLLIAANNVEGGFTVDITITPHWPTVTSNIDPNDDAASQEFYYSVTKLSESDLLNSSYQLLLPETKLNDSNNVPFIFSDTHIDSFLVQVTDDNPEDEGGSGGGFFFGPAPLEFEYTVDYDSIILMNQSDINQIFAWSAGVPDEDIYTSLYGKSSADYQNDVVAYYGPDGDITDTANSFNGKVDSDGNRVRLADAQYNYVTDLTAYADELSGYVSSTGVDEPATDEDESVATGDYLLVSVYHRGTGQNQNGSGQSTVYGRNFATNYFNVEGDNAVIDFWQENILVDNELVSLLKENSSLVGGSYIFEDSIEVSTQTNFWTYDFFDELDDKFGSDYEYSDTIALVAAIGNTAFEVTDQDLTNRINEDFENLFAELYYTEHLQPFIDFAATFDYGYRAQAYGIEGVDESVSASIIDLPESDNMAKGDGLRMLYGAAIMNDKPYMSMEAVTGTKKLQITWADVVAEINQNFSDGVNHVILHGTPYNKTWNGYNADWPGWLSFGTTWADEYTYRQPYWEDAESLGDYMARIQAVLQNGTAKIELAVMNSSTAGNSLQAFLDNGYSYSIFTEALTEMPKAIVSNGVLYEDGPAYKALVIDGLSKMSVDAIDEITSWAEDGLPVILLNTDITGVDGTERGSNTDAQAKAAFAELITSDNVYSATSEEAVLNQLRSLDLKSSSIYEQSQLEVTHYVDGGNDADFYYMYNNSYPENNGMIGTGHNENFKNESDIKNANITLEGEGIPYILNPWTGEITPVADYKTNSDGTITLNVSISAGDQLIIGIMEYVDGVETHDLHVTSKTGGETLYNGGDIVFRSNEVGTYAVVFSDGTTKTVKVDTALEAFDLSTLAWDLELISFGPDETADNQQSPIISSSLYDTADDYQLYKDPSQPLKSTVYFEDVMLGEWIDLPISAEQLETLGVESMEAVSGIGYYSTSFELPSDWTENTCAILNLGYSRDMITEITVNGNVIENVNVISDQVDIGNYLVEGTNAIKIKLISTLYNRASIENSAYEGGGGGPGWGVQISVMNTGLISAVLDPYTQIGLIEIPTAEPTTAPTTSDTTTETTTDGEDVPKTGDSLPYAALVLVVVAVLAGGGIVLLRKSHKRENTQQDE